MSFWTRWSFFWSRALGRPESSRAPTIESADPELPFDELLGPNSTDPRFSFSDVTPEVLSVFPAELSAGRSNSHGGSLDQNPDDLFFWQQASEDMLAGQISIYLTRRCPSPWWRSLCASNAYALAGSVIGARAVAALDGRRLDRSLYCEMALWPPQDFLILLDQAASQHPANSAERRFLLDSHWSLASSDLRWADACKHGALRLLWVALLEGRSVEWPDLPPRLRETDPMPAALPGLWIDADSLLATPVLCERDQAERAWLSKPQMDGSHWLLIPDWSSWMLRPSAPWRRFPTAREALSGHLGAEIQSAVALATPHPDLP